MTKPEPMDCGPGRPIHQKRSQETYDAMLQAGFELIEETGLERLRVADVALRAGYSVGSFYSRFADKDEFFAALLGKHLEKRNAALQYIFTERSADTLVEGLIADMLQYFADHRAFWRTALLLAATDAVIHTRIEAQSDRLAERFLRRLQEDLARRLRVAEKERIRFAFRQLVSFMNYHTMGLPVIAACPDARLHGYLVHSFKASACLNELSATSAQAKRSGSAKE